MKKKEMTLQVQPSSQTCFATAFAMALGINVSDLIKALGHDGTEIMFPELGVKGTRGHNVQELVDYCLKNDIRVVHINAFPKSYHLGVEPKQYMTDDEVNERFARYLADYYGVLTGIATGGTAHAVAWNGEMIFNPAGTIDMTFEHLTLMDFYIVGKL